MCNLVLGYTKGLMPIYNENINSYEYLGTLARKGLNKRLNNKVTEEKWSQLIEPLKQDVIKDLEYIDKRQLERL